MKLLSIILLQALPLITTEKGNGPCPNNAKLCYDLFYQYNSEAVLCIHTINKQEPQCQVNVYPDGRVIYGKRYAGKKTWKKVSAIIPKVCK